MVVFMIKYKFYALYAGITLNKSQKTNVFNFRRCIHRLEKGLSFPNTRQVFAEDFIGETVDLLIQGKNDNAFDDGSIEWGISVLNLYFTKVNHTPVIVEAFNRFKQSVEVIEHDIQIPFKESKRVINDISYDALMNLAKRRRSVRHYNKKRVEYEIIEKAYEIAKYSPSACNRQSFQFLFFNEPEIVTKLSSVPGGVAGYELPSLIVVLGNYSGYFNARDINAPIIDASLTIMSLLYALETLGLSSVCINWPNLPDREKKIRELIKIEEHEFVVMFIGIGYPDTEGKIPFSSKRKTNSVLEQNQRIIN